MKKIETLLRKSKKLYDVIPKTKTFRRKTTPSKPLDIQKQNVKALRYMNYARGKMYEIRELLKHELAPVSLYLAKENELRKPEKHDLINAIDATLQVSRLK